MILQKRSMILGSKRLIQIVEGQAGVLQSLYHWD